MWSKYRALLTTHLLNWEPHRDPTKCVANGYLQPDQPIRIYILIRSSTQFTAQYSAGVLDAGHSYVNIGLNAITPGEQHNYVDCTFQQ